MTAFWSSLQTTDLALWINYSRWAYAVATTAHVISIGVLLGSVLVLDLRLIGFGRRLDSQQLARLVVPVAATALCGAILSGTLLFIGRAAEYASFGMFRIKIALLVLAVGMTAAILLRFGRRLERAGDRNRFRIGLASISFWLCIAVAGRMIAFVHG